MKVANVVGVVLAGAVGLGAGALGLAGRPAAVPPSLHLVGDVVQRVSVLDCPSGAAVDSLTAGDRVLVLARSADGEYVAIRAAAEGYSTVWVRADDLVAASILDLPVDDCVHPEVDE